MKRLAVSGLLMAALLSPSAALAVDENENASCMGIEASEISPPGTSAEEPFGAAGLHQELSEVADFLGVPVGAIYTIIAQTKAGSHAACDEALGE